MQGSSLHDPQNDDATFDRFARIVAQVSETPLASTLLEVLNEQRAVINSLRAYES